MLVTQNSVMNLLIGKKIARTATPQIIDPSTTATYIADGEVLVVDASGTVLDSTTVVGKDSIRLVQGQGANKPLIWSDEIFASGVKSYKGKSYTAPTVQIDYIGFDAVTGLGTYDVISNNDYEIHLFDIDSTTFGTLGNSKYGFYTSDSSATGLEVAKNLTESLFTNTRDLIFPNVTIEMVTNGTYASANNAQTFTLTNGSVKVFVTGASLVAVGDLIRVTTNTNVIAVYYVEALGLGAFPGAGANDFRINYPYQGVSGSGLTVYHNTIAPTSFGTRVTGKAPYYIAPNLTNYHVNRWKTTVLNSGVTPVINEQAGTEGSGTYEQISQIEYFLLGNEGLAARQGVIPQIAIRANVEPTGTYGIVSLNHFRQTQGQVMQSPVQWKQLMLAFNQLGGNGTNFTGVVTSVETVLNAWLPGFTALAI